MTGLYGMTVEETAVELALSYACVVGEFADHDLQQDIQSHIYHCFLHTRDWRYSFNCAVAKAISEWPAEFSQPLIDAAKDETFLEEWFGD